MKIMRWVYLVRQVLIEESPEIIQDKLNQAGDKGWELVGTSSLGHSDKLFWVFKKPNGYVPDTLKSEYGTAGER